MPFDLPAFIASQRAVSRDIVIPSGTYDVLTHIDLRAPGVRLRGSGYYDTTLVLAHPDAGLTLNADSQALENLQIEVAPKHRALARNRPMLTVSGNGVRARGIRLHGSDSSATAFCLDGRTDNSNHGVFEDVEVRRTHIPGMLFGRDSAANVFRDLTIRDCATGWIESGAFLGNSYWNFAAYASGIKRGGQGYAFVCCSSAVLGIDTYDFWLRFRGDIAKDLQPAPNSRTVLWNPYIEKGQRLYLHKPQMVLGGVLSSDPGCPYISDGELVRFDIRRAEVHLAGMSLRSASTKEPGLWAVRDTDARAELAWKNGGLISAVLPKK